MTAPNLYNPDPGEWIKWSGGVCPVHPDTIVRPWFKGVGEAKHTYPASKLNWGRRNEEGSRLPGSILGYRIEEKGE